MAKLCACVPIFVKQNLFASRAGHCPRFMNSRNVLPVVSLGQHSHSADNEFGEAMSALSASFDHLVSGCEQSWRHREAKCLSGLKVDDKLEVSRLLDRQISWFCSFENLPDVDASLTIQRREASL